MGRSTLTHKTRTKRPDGRELSSKRKSASQRRLAAKESVSDIRITRVQASERKVRSMDIQAMPLRSERVALSDNDKLLRSLRKKLRSMEPLIKKQRAGEQLDDSQLAKLEGLDGIVADLAGVAEKIALENGNANPGPRSTKKKDVKAPVQNSKKSARVSYPIADEKDEQGYYNSEPEESDSDD
jgi:hypothetical protein